MKTFLTLLLGFVLGGAVLAGYARYESVLPCDILKVEAVAASQKAVDREITRRPSIAQLRSVSGPFVRMAVESKFEEKGWSQADCIRIAYRWLTGEESELVAELFPEIESFRELGKSLKGLEKTLRGLGGARKPDGP